MVFTSMPLEYVIVADSVARPEMVVVWDMRWLYKASAFAGACDFAEYNALLECAQFTNIMELIRGPITAI